jgi:hypothetical protein
LRITFRKLSRGLPIAINCCNRNSDVIHFMMS